MDVVERLSVPKKHFTQYKTTAGLIITQRRLITGPQCENTSSNPPVGVGEGERISYDGQYGEASPERDIFFRPYVYERVGISLVFKYIKE